MSSSKSAMLCFTCSVNKKSCVILKIPGLTADKLTKTCPDYRRQVTPQTPLKTNEKVIQAKLF